jgi:hypothetical protein
MRSQHYKVGSTLFRFVQYARLRIPVHYPRSYLESRAATDLAANSEYADPSVASKILSPMPDSLVVVIRTISTEQCVA